MTRRHAPLGELRGRATRPSGPADKPGRIHEYVLWYGRDLQPPDQTELRAGPLTALLEDGDLRYIRLRGREIVRRIYVAIRDVNWNTIPAERSGMRVEQGDDRFRVTYASRHRKMEIAYSWHALIEGSPDGTLSFSMDGTAESEFNYGRIGLCVLHPEEVCAGQQYRAETPDGTVDGVLPLLIAPQRKVNGISQPLFGWFSHLKVSTVAGVEVNCDFEGDLFGMEDQRNWLDASFKTYSAPPAHGAYHRAHVGDEYGQRVTIRITDHPADKAVGAAGTERRSITRPLQTNSTQGKPRDALQPIKDRGPTLSLGAQLAGGLPRLGLGIATHKGELTSPEVELLGRLGLDHLRADLRLWDPAFRVEMAQAVRQAAALGCALELAVFVTDDAEAQLADLATAVVGGPAGHPGLAEVPVVRVLVFHEPRAAWETTPGRLVRLTRRLLAHLLPRAAFGGGTNGYFAELNRMPPQVAAMDVVSYTANPQIHAFDEASLAENLHTLATTVRTARMLCSDRPIAVSRLTLKAPFNQDAERLEAPDPAGELPSYVDPRQMSLFGAAWTVGAVKYLAEAGAASVTLYETTGWAGLMEKEAGCAEPSRFPSQPGMIFPMFHVLADLAAWKEVGTLVECISSHPLAVVGLGLRLGRGAGAPDEAGRPRGGWGILVANLGPTTRQITVGPFLGDSTRLTARVRHMNSITAPDAMFRPAQFRARWSTQGIRSEGMVVRVGPYGVATVEVTTQPGLP